MRNFIIKKLKKWLGINDLFNKIEHQKNQIQFLNSLVKVGVDIHLREDSWDVVCLAGKPEYVKFFNLPVCDIRSIREFLRQFENRNVHADTPPFLRKML